MFMKNLNHYPFSPPLRHQTYRSSRDSSQNTELTWPLRTDIVTINFFSHAFSYTTLIGLSPPPVFSQIVMLLLAIKSWRVGGEQAKSNRTLNIFILLHGLIGISASWYAKHEYTRHILSSPSSSLILLVYCSRFEISRAFARAFVIHQLSSFIAGEYALSVLGEKGQKTPCLTPTAANGSCLP